MVCGAPADQSALSPLFGSRIGSNRLLTLERSPLSTLTNMFISAKRQV